MPKGRLTTRSSRFDLTTWNSLTIHTPHVVPRLWQRFRLVLGLSRYATNGNRLRMHVTRLHEQGSFSAVHNDLEMHAAHGSCLRFQLIYGPAIFFYIFAFYFKTFTVKFWHAWTNVDRALENRPQNKFVGNGLLNSHPIQTPWRYCKPDRVWNASEYTKFVKTGESDKFACSEGCKLATFRTATFIGDRYRWNVGGIPSQRIADVKPTKI